MRISRLAVQASDRTINLDFHPHLTVITGVGSTTRESIIQELLGGLSTHRSGTHMEVVTDAGRELTVFRPPDAAHRVIDVANKRDVSREFTRSDGTIDLLDALGMDAATARRRTRVGRNDLSASTQSHDLIARLGRIDQRSLWSDAQRVQISRDALERDDERQGQVPEVEDVSLTERIDHNYHSLDAALEQADRTRLLAIVVGTVSLLAAGIAANANMATASILIAVAAAATITAFVFRARVNYFARQLSDALDQSGSDSYLSYQLDRIDGYTSSEHQRRHRSAVEADVADALERWQRTAGDVDVDWALAHRPAIEAAARLSAGGGNPQVTEQALVPRHALDETPGLVDALTDRFADSRNLGEQGESFPLLLDEPFAALDPAVRPALLEILVHQADQSQAILLTNSEDITSWARLEAMTGALSIVGPGEGSSEAPESSSEPSGDDAGPVVAEAAPGLDDPGAIVVDREGFEPS